MPETWSDPRLEKEGQLGPGEALAPSFRSEREVTVFSLHRLELDSISLGAKSFCWISNLAQRTHPNGCREEWLTFAIFTIDHSFICLNSALAKCLPGSASEQLFTFPTSYQTGYWAPPEPPKSSIPTASDCCLFLGPTWKSNVLDIDYKTGSAPKDISQYCLIMHFNFTSNKLSTF